MTTSADLGARIPRPPAGVPREEWVYPLQSLWPDDLVMIRADCDTATTVRDREWVSTDEQRTETGAR